MTGWALIDLNTSKKRTCMVNFSKWNVYPRTHGSRFHRIKVIKTNRLIEGSGVSVFRFGCEDLIKFHNFSKYCTRDQWSIHFSNCQWSWRRRIEFVGILLVLGSICFNCLAPQTCFFEMDGCCLAGCQTGLFKNGDWGDEHNLFMGEIIIVNDKPRHTYVDVLWCFGVLYCAVPGKPLQIHSEGLEVILLEPFIGEPAVPSTTSHRTHCALRECLWDPSPNICVTVFPCFNRWFSHHTWQLSKQACWIFWTPMNFDGENHLFFSSDRGLGALLVEKFLKAHGQLYEQKVPSCWCHILSGDVRILRNFYGSKWDPQDPQTSGYV